MLFVFFLLSSIADGQDEPAKQKAIEQMRRVVKAMKQCPEQVSSSQDECQVHKSHAGPPTNLEWDVVPSKTVRSPFQGIIEFTLPTRLEDIEQLNLSKKARQQCANKEAQLEAMGAPAVAELAEKGPEWREGHYRYEFDVGSDDPELVKMLWIAKDRNNNVVTSEANDSGHECWVAAARSIGLKQDTLK